MNNQSRLKLTHSNLRNSQTMHPTQRKRINWSLVLLRMFILGTIFAISPLSALADGGSGGGGGGSGSGGSGGSGGSQSSTAPNKSPNDATQTGAFDVREDYRRANKLSIPFGPPTQRNPEGLDEVKDRESQGPGTVDHGPGPVYIWPVKITSATSKVPTKRDTGITKHRLQTFGLPISDTQFQMIHRMDQQIMLEEMFDPERVMWLAASMGTSQAQDASNSCANMARNQGASAIDYVACSIYNFTVDDNNKWNKIRNQLFLPMAILLLLPGAVLAQVRVIVAAGMPIIGGDVNPFEGITRSIVAIFLIPATYLVVNYGIDLNNSITYTISNEYSRIFGSNMYKDALCTIIRAFPVRQAHENRNGIFKPVKDWSKEAKTPAEGMESRSLLTKTEDPCTGTFETDPDRADEQAPFLSVGQRFVTNSTNAVLMMTWNTLCAFQVVFLCYLWLVGPVIAALWVYPMGQLRSALGGWVEGVITLCFWALFWNTTVLLYACFRGVDSTGSVIVSALDFLAIQCVKSAFDFAGLVKEAGKEAVGNAMGKAAQGANPGASGGGKGGGAHGGRGAGSHAGGSHAGGGTHGGGHGAGSHGHGAGGHAVGADGHGSHAGVGGHGGMGTSLAISAASVSGASIGADRGGGSGGPGGLGEKGGIGGLGDRMGGMNEPPGIGGLTAALGGGDAAGIVAAMGAPPMIGGDINTLNSIGVNSSFNLNSSSFSSMAASSLTMGGNVIDMNGNSLGISGRDAANLIGVNNFANYPAGQTLSNEQARAAFEQARSDVRNMNISDPGNAADRDKLMNNWQDMLNAGENASPGGGAINMPSGIEGVSAGGGYNVAGSAVLDPAGSMLQQGTSSVYGSMSASVQAASDAINLMRTSPNPEALQGITSLAREMSRDIPTLAGGGDAIAINAKMQEWSQRADSYARDIMQPSVSGGAMSLGAASVELAAAQNALTTLQQKYPEVAYAGGNAMPPSDYARASNYASGGEGPIAYGNTGYSGGGGQVAYGPGGVVYGDSNQGYAGGGYAGGGYAGGGYAGGGHPGGGSGYVENSGGSYARHESHHSQPLSDSVSQAGGSTSYYGGTQQGGGYDHSASQGAQGHSYQNQQAADPNTAQQMQYNNSGYGQVDPNSATGQVYYANSGNQYYYENANTASSAAYSGYYDNSYFTPVNNGQPSYYFDNSGQAMQGPVFQDGGGNLFYTTASGESFYFNDPSNQFVGGAGATSQTVFDQGQQWSGGYSYDAGYYSSPNPGGPQPGSYEHMVSQQDAYKAQHGNQAAPGWEHMTGSGHNKPDQHNSASAGGGYYGAGYATRQSGGGSSSSSSPRGSEINKFGERPAQQHQKSQGASSASPSSSSSSSSSAAQKKQDSLNDQLLRNKQQAKLSEEERARKKKEEEERKRKEQELRDKGQNPWDNI